MLSIFKRSNQTSERQLRKYRKIVQQINKLEATYEPMSDEQLTSMTDYIQRDESNLEKKSNLLFQMHLLLSVKHPNEFLACVISMYS